MKLAGQSLKPLYQQVMDDIRDSIEVARYAPGDKIPSEGELSELYGVSRITIRRAIEELAKEGFLTKKQGKGTYVNPPMLTRKIRQSSSVKSFSDMCQEVGKTSGADVLSIATENATESIATLLELPVNAPILRVIRVGTADGIPVATENATFPRDFFDFLQDTDLHDASLFSVMEERTRRRVHHRRRTIEVVHANSYLADLLKVNIGEPMFRELAVFFDEDDQVLFACRLHFIARMFVFEV